MMGATHGLAGLTVGAGIVIACHAAGAALGHGQAAAVVVAAAIAGEIPDLDLSQSRISHGRSSLMAVPYFGVIAALITLPVILAGIAIRTLRPEHRGPTHSIAAQALWAAAIVPLYGAYWWGLDELARVAAAHWPTIGLLHLDTAAAAARHAWPTAAPWCALAVLLGGLSHLVLDDLTPAPQALLWPLRSKKLTVLRRPTIQVGGAREKLLVTLPLAIVLSIAGLHAARPHLHVPDFRTPNLNGPARQFLDVGGYAARSH